jgi:mRNA interferase MazF
MKVDPNFVYQQIDWMKLKLDINLTDKEFFPDKKEIWWVSLGQNVGVEINGKHSKFERPVLVVKAFNVDSFLVVPITSKIKQGQYFFGFISSSNERQTANLSQLRTISVKRFLRKLDVMNDEDFNQVVELIKGYLEKTETPSSGVSSESTNSVRPNVVSIED